MLIHGTLSPREAEVVAALVNGHAEADIAAAIRVSRKTVNSLKRRAMEKLGLSSDAEIGAHVARSRMRAILDQHARGDIGDLETIVAIRIIVGT